MKQVTARDIMIRKVICVSANMDIRELESVFLDKKISGAPVLNEKGVLAGVISQKDIVAYHHREERDLAWESNFYERPRLEGQPLPAGFSVVNSNRIPRVQDMMTPTVISASPDTPVQHLAKLMREKRVHRIIILTESSGVAGIVSALDLLSLL